jgi:Na+-driven multidrug efflux pump
VYAAGWSAIPRLFTSSPDVWHTSALVPITLAASRWDWGIGGVWAGLTSFIPVRLVGVVWRARTDRWVVLGSA